MTLPIGKPVVSMAEWLMCWISTQKVWGSSPSQVMEIVPLDKVLITNVFPFAKGYKWVPTIVGEVNLQQTGMLFRGVEILQVAFMPRKPGISTGQMGH